MVWRVLWGSGAFVLLVAGACAEGASPGPGGGTSRAGTGGRGGAAGRGAGEGAGRGPAGGPSSNGGAHAGSAATDGGEGGSHAGKGPTDGGEGGKGAGAGGDVGQGGNDAGEGGEPDAGRGGAPSDDEPTPIPVVDESGLPLPSARAGFVELPPVAYTLGTQAKRSTLTRIFYNLLPADEGAKQKPLFVVFNGGPGASTALLRSFGTGHRSLDGAAVDAPSRVNPTSFTALGSVLYVDSRQAGYSYGLTDDPARQDERASGFDDESFNEFADAADFVRTLLGVFEVEPALENNPVVIVGESYGGVRSPLMLLALLHSDWLGNGSWYYQDPALAKAVSAHLSRVFQRAAGDVTPAQAAKQFGWQVLLEPYITGMLGLSPDAALERSTKLALELGITPEQLQARCGFDVSRTLEECDAVLAASDRVSLDPSEFEAFNGFAPAAVPGLAAAERTGAFRFVVLEPDPAPDPFGLGDLPDWDRYYLPGYSSAPSGDPWGLTFRRGPFVPEAFIASVAYANTLVTNAAYDTVVVGAENVPAWREVIALAPTLGLLDVGYDGANPDEPSEAIHIELAQNETFGRGGARTIWFPSFAKSGHFVSINEPERLFAKVSEFLAATGLGGAG